MTKRSHSISRSKLHPCGFDLSAAAGAIRICLLCLALIGCAAASAPVPSAPLPPGPFPEDAVYAPANDPVYQEHLRRVTEQRGRLLEQERLADPQRRDGLERSRREWEREQAWRLNEMQRERQEDWRRRQPDAQTDSAAPPDARTNPAGRADGDEPSPPARRPSRLGQDQLRPDDARQFRHEGLWKKRQRRESLSVPAPEDGFARPALTGGAEED
jgi:hypothetical protein